MNYRLLAPAINDLEHIEAWVESNFGQAAAYRTTLKLTHTFELLSSFQKMGKERPLIAPTPMRFFSDSHNWIIYEPGKPLLIHRIFPAALDIHTFRP